MNNFVIVGGGLSGYLSALFLRSDFPDAKITVIESKKLGILGAGEGTTDLFIKVLNKLNIPLKRVFKETSATVKYGIKFTNWSKDKDYFFEGFGVYDVNNMKRSLSYIETISELIEHGNYDRIDRTAFLCSNDKFVSSFDSINTNGYTGALHIDAYGIADLLSNIAQERNVEIIDDLVIDVMVDSGNISNLVLESGLNISTDFVIDCTGFHRHILKHLDDSKWIDYSHILPANRATTFMLPIITEYLPAYTESIAMKNGWIWKIPLQNRFGCGYVHNSNMVSEDEIKKEIIELFGNDVSFNRSIDFNPGIYEKTWIGNCVAVGLSSSFVEPLEASSIATSLISLIVLMGHLKNPTNLDESRDIFNKIVLDFFNSVVDTIALHYHSDRDDSDFWRSFSIDKYLENPIKDVKMILEKPDIKNELETNSFASIFGVNGPEPLRLVSLSVILLIALNNNIISKDDLMWIKDRYPEIYEFAIYSNGLQIENNQKLLDKSVSHLEFIELVKQNKDYGANK